MVNGDGAVAKAQVQQYVADGVQHLGFGEQGPGARNVHVTLIKLAKAPLGGAVGAPHRLDLVALEEAG